MCMIILGLFIYWFGWTPSGFWGKMNSIAYAVCHRIAGHSFFFLEQQMPLCSRCTGMYIGAAVGLSYFFSKPRKAAVPSRKILIALLGLVLLFAIDGINSALQFFPGFEGLYSPNNTLRLITGSGMGIVIASMLVPVFNLSVWKNAISEKLLEKWWQLLMLAGGVALLDFLVLSQYPWVLFLTAILSVLTVVVILTLAYTTLLILLLKRDSTFTTIRSILPWLLAGFGCAFFQIFFMDAIRFVITGTWAGFTL
jgi:uncharacterized membrane protein